MQALAFVNQKGGVGKTTTAVNLAACFADVGLSTLLVDLDPQGNATTSCGLDRKSVVYSVHDCLSANRSVPQALVEVKQNFSLLPANIDLVATERLLWDLEDRERVLAGALRGVSRRYEFVLIDCPPSLSLLTVNGLVAAQKIVIPMQCEYFALEGLAALLETLEGVKTKLHSAAELFGIVRTMYDPRTALAGEVSAQLKQHFGAKVFRSVIPRNVRLAEAPSHGLPIVDYDARSRGAQAYRALAAEVLRKCGKGAAARKLGAAARKVTK